MKNKNFNLKLLIAVALNFFVCFFLTILILPNQIPIVFNFNEKIVAVGSKWLMFLSAIVPTIVGIIALKIKNHVNLKFWLVVLFAFFVYQNMLAFIYLSLSNNLAIGNVCEVPFSVSIFMPLSVVIIVYGAKIKRASFKSNWAINLKSMQKTEFIWLQSHLFASHAVMLSGLILFICSIIFVFVRLWWILLIVLAVIVIICLLTINSYTLSLVKKYEDMERRKDKVNKDKFNKETNSQTEDKKI